MRQPDNIEYEVELWFVLLGLSSSNDSPNKTKQVDSI